MKIMFLFPLVIRDKVYQLHFTMTIISKESMFCFEMLAVTKFSEPKLLVFT